MKRASLYLTLAASAALLASCAGLSLPGVSVGLSAPNLSGGASPMASSAGGMDFKKDEVLCLRSDDDPLTGSYYLGRVLTPASGATKDQAEVLFVESGKKEWSARVLPSRKTDKPDYTIGTTVFYPSGWADHEKLDQDQYRFATWRLGNVTNNDELFKGMVEVDGDKYYTKLLRIATVPLQ